MSTVRQALTEAMRLLKAAAPGDAPTVDELSVGLDAAQRLVLEWHESAGPLRVIDVPGPDYQGSPGAVAITPGENQRLRIQAGFTATVTLPNSISMWANWDPYDYGFVPGQISAYAPIGSTGAADGIEWRVPRDGARIEVVGTTQGLWVYRDDTNAWAPALNLTLDTELPLNARLQGHFAMLLAERLADVLSNLPEPTKPMLARVAASREALFARFGRYHAPTRGEYF